MTKTVFAAIIGKPNVGKSTLLNRLLRAKLAITSPKPQTTRGRVMGVLTEGAVQYVFMDTPGYHVPRTKLGEQMQKAVRDAVAEIDVALFVVYPKERLEENERALFAELKKANTPVVLVMNKADTLKDRAEGARMTAALLAENAFDGALAVSAATGDGLPRLLETVAEYGEEGPFLYDPDTLTDIPEKVIVSEIIREKLLMNLSDELPHGTAVNVERFLEKDGAPAAVDATILCEKQSHKGMIIGKDGKMLKKIMAEARRDIEETLGRRVRLKCWVKVREGWRNNAGILREFGLGQQG